MPRLLARTTANEVGIFMGRIRVWLLVVAATIAAAPGAADRPAILVLGDSLSAAYGIPLEAGWVHLLQARIEAAGLPHRVVNASVSGETSAGGLSRLPALLSRVGPELVVIELGGNDGLRGLPPAALEENLRTMATLAHNHGARVLLVGMQMPPNYGPAYTARFSAVYREVAEELKVPLVPFLLTGVAENRALMQADGIHATAAAQPKLLENVWKKLGPMLKQAQVRGAAKSTNPAPPPSTRRLHTVPPARPGSVPAAG